MITKINNVLVAADGYENFIVPKIIRSGGGYRQGSSPLFATIASTFPNDRLIVRDPSGNLVGRIVKLNTKTCKATLYVSGKKTTQDMTGYSLGLYSPGGVGEFVEIPFPPQRRG